jgi:uncharacterized protein YjiS (DUF1127 family)
MLCPQVGAAPIYRSAADKRSQKMSILSLPGARVSIRRSDREQRAAGWAVAGCRTVARWLARLRQRRALREIAVNNDFHLLKDIGVSQEEALREAEKPFWRR